MVIARIRGRPITTDAEPYISGSSQKKGWMNKRFKNSRSWRTGCPIDFLEAEQSTVLPEGRADQGEESRVTVLPLAQLGTETQQRIDVTKWHFVCSMS